jgi:DNA-binding FadR family transcriptional regulator
MPPTKSKPIPKSWAAALQESLEQRGKLPPGEGWKTLAELREEFGMGAAKLRACIRQLREAGMVEEFNGTAMTGGSLNRQIWYRLKSN